MYLSSQSQPPSESNIPEPPKWIPFLLESQYGAFFPFTETADATVNSASVIVNGNVACAKELKGKIAKIATTIWAKVLVRKNFTMLLDIIFKLF